MDFVAIVMGAIGLLCMTIGGAILWIERNDMPEPTAWIDPDDWAEVDCKRQEQEVSCFWAWVCAILGAGICLMALAMYFR